jgi:carbonic anhydrase
MNKHNIGKAGMKDLTALVSGFRRFQENFFSEDTRLFDQLKKAQRPKVLVIACCDSRVDPSLLTDCDPGDLFVIRNVANLVPPYQPDAHYHGVSAAVEYAVCFLNVEHILIMGHSQCGGIQSLMEKTGGCEDGDNEFIDNWVSLASPAKEMVLKELADKPKEIQTRACEQASILLSLENLLTFPQILKRVEAGTLSLQAWYVDIQTGALLSYNPKSGEFEVLVNRPQ